jgi:excinuclease ABC subunit C
MGTFNHKAVITQIPPLPGVYRFVDSGGAPLYVGKAANLKKRVTSYFQKTRLSPRIRLMLTVVHNVEVTVTASDNAALLLENNLIKSLKPKYNILFRDDKSYPFLRLTRQPYAQVLHYRGVAGDDDCFGPFPDSDAVRKTIDMIQRLFRLRTCADTVFANRTRPCLLYGIGRCSAPCVNRITPAHYASDVASARALLTGDSRTVERDLRTRMEKAAEEEDFERAAVLRDRLRALAVLRERHFVDDRKTPNADYVGACCDEHGACVNVVMVRGGRRVGERRFFPVHAAGATESEVLAAFIAQHYGSTSPPKIVLSHRPTSLPLPLASAVIRSPRGESKMRAQQAATNARLALALQRSHQLAAADKMQALADRLTLAKVPRRIECFDISHSMGEEPVASRVVFVDGAAQTAEYRRYKIAAAGGDDCAAMHEAVRRCYRRAVSENAVLPDLLIIDGGVGQVRAAQAALQEVPTTIFLLGVAKGAARKAGEETLIMADGEVMQLPPDDPALHLLQAVRDEAHRFAVDGHRKRRDKKRRVSTLEDIEGVGPQLRRRLLQHFGGLRGLKAAGEGELIKIEGVGVQMARRIYHFFS